MNYAWLSSFNCLLPVSPTYASPLIPTLPKPQQEESMVWQETVERVEPSSIYPHHTYENSHNELV